MYRALSVLLAGDWRGVSMMALCSGLRLSIQTPPSPSLPSKEPVTLGMKYCVPGAKAK
jgi:hypothetical protein